MQKIYGAPPPSIEEYHEVTKDIQTTLQGMRTQGYELEGLAQSNAVLTSSNSAVMEHLEHMEVTMNAMKAQLKTISSEQTNQLRPKRKFYCWICGRNFTHESKTSSEKKLGHQ